MPPAALVPDRVAYYQSGVLLHRHEPGASHPGEPRGFRPGLYPGEIRELLARPGFEDPVADLRVDPVSRVEELHQVPGIGQPDPAGLGELATLAEPGHERADLARKSST